MSTWRKRLPRAFSPFFGRFTRLTDIQADAVPLILEGHDTLICSPTASGKTEAYAAPAAELVLGARPHPALVLIVSPTRALANDLKRRLEAAMLEAGVRFGRHTGEHKEHAQGFPEIAVTTPEALDSLLARRPSLLKPARMVVMDEIHVLDATPRGDQLRVLLHRLDRAAGRRVQRVAVSATIEDPEGMAKRYLHAPRVVEKHGGRRIKGKRFDGGDPVSMARHIDALASHGFRKILVFCNRRADVERYATRLRGHTRFADLVLPHHGSLSRNERERTEKRFLDAGAAVAFSTMTLEMGIDIGTVDYVLLASPPPDVPSLLQRIGRGSRRGNEVRCGYVADDVGEVFQYRVLFESGARGELLGTPYALRPGVIVQQALVAAGSHGWVDGRRLQRVVPSELWSDIEPTTAEEILESMADAELLDRQPGDRYVLSEPLETRYDAGSLHSNISADIAVQIVDRSTGDVVGTVSPDQAKRFQLGGQGRTPVLQQPDRILSDPTRSGAAPKFTSMGSPSASLAYGRRVVERLGVAPGEIGLLRDGLDQILLHGLGTIGGLLLSRALEHAHGHDAVIASTPFSCRLSRPVDALPKIGEPEIEEFVTSHARKLARVCSMGPHHAHLPHDLQLRAVRRAGDLDGILQALLVAKLTTMALEDLTDPAAAVAL